MASKKEIRLVCYPMVVGMEVKNFYGFFDVEMLAGKPVRAQALSIDRFPEVACALDTASQMWDTMFNSDTLLSLDTVDPSKGEWDGTLTF